MSRVGSGRVSGGEGIDGATNDRVPPLEGEGGGGGGGSNELLRAGRLDTRKGEMNGGGESRVGSGRWRGPGDNRRRETSAHQQP